MNLYLAQHDGNPYYIEAATISEAVELWKLYQGIRDGEEPESISCVHDRSGASRFTGYSVSKVRRSGAYPSDSPVPDKAPEYDGTDCNSWWFRVARMRRLARREGAA